MYNEDFAYLEREALLLINTFDISENSEPLVWFWFIFNDLILCLKLFHWKPMVILLSCSIENSIIFLFFFWLLVIVFSATVEYGPLVGTQY